MDGQVDNSPLVEIYIMQDRKYRKFLLEYRWNGWIYSHI